MATPAHSRGPTPTPTPTAIDLGTRSSIPSEEVLRRYDPCPGSLDVGSGPVVSTAIQQYAPPV